MSDEWGDWIEHDGLPVPGLAGKWVRTCQANGHIGVGPMRDGAEPILAHPGGMGFQYISVWIWASLPRSCWPQRILRYQIRKPRALLELIDLIENLPAPQPEVA